MPTNVANIKSQIKRNKTKLDAIVREWHKSGFLIALGERTGMAPSQALRDLHEQYSHE